MAKSKSKSRSKKYVYFFGGGKAEGHGGMKELLGGKGAGLAEMTNAGIPVPPGFTITTEACVYYYKNRKKWPEGLEEQIKKYMDRLEKVSGLKFGDPKNPLLVSVRSGARVSMPGMMDTVLNLGLNDKTVKGLAEKTNNERFAYDSYRRFIQMFGNVVMGIKHEKFEEKIRELKEKKGVKNDIDLTSEDLKQLVEHFKDIVKKETGKEFPQNVNKQLKMAINAVFESWNNPRAITYRKINNIPDDWGTAVNIVMMVFGNMGFDSGTGVGFTRNPATGEKELYGEYLLNAQGEDVVAGIRTPHQIKDMAKELPEVYKQLVQIAKKLEQHYRDMQDFEFTIQQGKLYMLQTRTGKRTALAALKIAVDMVKEKLITPEEAVKRVPPESLEQILHPIFDPEKRKEFKVIAKGLPASPGAASGIVVFDPNSAVEKANAGEDVILVRMETSPDDIHGMHAAKGFLTATGGMTSHAAVVGRAMGKPAVVGCGDLQIKEAEKFMKVKDNIIKEGDYISIDGSSGEVILGQVPVVPSEVIQVVLGQKKPQESKTYKYFSQLLKWADKYRRLGVRANADTPKDAEVAFAFGAEGIGLARTEHMFFAKERLPIMQDMIMATSKEEREKFLEKLKPMQKEDFKALFRAMKGHPVTIRLLDPPLHEFLPKREELMVEIAKMETEGAPPEKIEEKKKILARVNELHEFNPMLGLRGCRLGLIFPEITKMQVSAIIEAAIEVQKEGIKVRPEIMVPLTSSIGEMKEAKKLIVETADEIIKKAGIKLNYKVGTMIEIPRAALTADKIAEEAEFFSFGTNDLTQMTFGFSRDDVGRIIDYYVEKGILEADPFQKLDQKGVGQLLKLGTERGRSTRPDLKVGICGEHGGEPSSVKFCHRVGLNYVSCSPYRVPVARLAAAQAALEEKQVQKGVTQKKSSKRVRKK